MSKKIKQLPEPSKEFWDAVISSVGYVDVKCDFCGRVHYSTAESDNNYEEGKLEKLEKQNKENPDKYLEHAEGIHYGNINGKQAVFGCPCNKALIYEKLFWNNRYLIATYFQNKTKKIREFSEETSNLAKRVKDSIEGFN